MTEKTDTQSAIDAGMQLARVQFVNGNPFAVIPEDCTLRDLEHLCSVPTRLTGTSVLRDTASFIRMVKQQITPNTAIYGSVNPPEFVAVFNDHYKDTPGWRDYKAVYACPLSVEWKTWTGQSGKQLSQEQFARFIEDNLPDVASPPAAEMLEISRTLEAKKKVNFASGIRLSNGENQITYEEQVSGTAAKGMITVPEEFTIGIPVLEGGARYAVTARLRYRIQEGGKLAMWFELVRPHKILEDAVSDVWKEIESKTSLQIFNGKPA